MNDLDPGSSGQFLILIVLLLFSAFFSASETALTSLSKIRLRNMLDENVKDADKIKNLVDNPNKLLSALLIGNNVVNICASAIATMIFVKRFGEDRGVGIATVVMTIVVLIFAEITPKTLAAQNSEKMSLWAVNIVSFFVTLLTPIIFILNITTHFFVKISGGSTKKQLPLITEAELKTLVNVSHEEGVLEVEERRMINNVFDFGDAKAKDIMTPRTDIISTELATSYDDIFQIFKNERFSRIPVYSETIDNIVGILHLKDFMIADKDNFCLQDIIRVPFFTYEYKFIDELFTQMRTKRIQVAIILDEYGGTSGLVSIEDLVEEIVGDIADEYDEDEEEIEVVKEDEYIIDGGAKIDDVNEMIGTKLESVDFDSLGGYVIGVLGRFPEQGEVVESDGLKFVVEEVEKNRIEKIRVHT